MEVKLSRKVQRKALYDTVRETYRAWPDLSYQDLADMFGLSSRYHAWWIVNKQGREKRGNRP